MNKEDSVDNDVKLHKVKEGFLIKRSRILKEWKRRWMVLTRTHLYSFETQGSYCSPTEKIPLKDVSTIKSYYKSQYDRENIIRIQSEDTFFYLSAKDHQEKWAWMTAIERMTEQTNNVGLEDSQQVIRETLRISTAIRQSNLAYTPRRSTNTLQNVGFDVMKQMKLAIKNRVVNDRYMPNYQNNKPNFKKTVQNSSAQLSVHKGVQRIVEVQRIVQVQKIVMVPDDSGNLSEIFTQMINSKLDDPKPMLQFVSYLGMCGIQKYQTIALKFCYETECHRFFSELLLQALNQQVQQERLNRYTGFLYIICERQPDYLYSSDMRILVEIILRQLQLFRSQLNQCINLYLLRVLLTHHIAALANKRDDIWTIVSEIGNTGAPQNSEVAQSICLLLHQAF